MIAAFIISLSLLGLSGLLIDSHRRSWAAARDAAELPDRDKRFALAQYRRRMQASSMIGLIGVAIGGGPLVPREPRPMALYLAMLLVSCAWIMLLSLLDVWATRQHYQRLRMEQLAKQLQLALELASAGETSEAEG
jgi:hypothetical protein